jgi:hypothetical protein
VKWQRWSSRSMDFEGHWKARSDTGTFCGRNEKRSKNKLWTFLGRPLFWHQRTLLNKNLTSGLQCEPIWRCHSGVPVVDISCGLSRSGDFSSLTTQRTESFLRRGDCNEAGERRSLHDVSFVYSSDSESAFCLFSLCALFLSLSLLLSCLVLSSFFLLFSKTRFPSNFTITLHTHADTHTN